MNEQQIVGRYPKTIVLKDGTKVLLREMTRSDREGVYEFFAKIPEEDRKFLKHDVTKKEVIDAWLKDIDYARVFPLLAEVDGKIVADATLHRRSSGGLRHVGGVRVVVFPTYPAKGPGCTP